MPDVIPYVYLTATSFSGSTLLALLLDTHPKIVSIGELTNRIDWAIEQGRHVEYPCSCGEPIRQCAFFGAVRSRCAEQGLDLDLHDFPTKLGSPLGMTLRRLLFGTSARFPAAEKLRKRVLGVVPMYRRHIQGVMDRGETIARAVLDVSGKQVFLDTSKGHSRIPYLHSSPGVDLRLLHVVRDVRAIAYSHVKRGRSNIERAVRSWVRLHLTALRLGKALSPDRRFILHWDEFCSHPQEMLDEIVEFMGLERADVISKVNDQPHHVVGNTMRLKRVGAIRSDESWRENLPPKHLATCERIAGKLNRSFGCI